MKIQWQCGDFGQTGLTNGSVRSASRGQDSNISRTVARISFIVAVVNKIRFGGGRPTLRIRP